MMILFTLDKHILEQAGKAEEWRAKLPKTDAVKE
jgi:hypothetical protein